MYLEHYYRMRRVHFVQLGRADGNCCDYAEIFNFKKSYNLGDVIFAQVCTNQTFLTSRKYNYYLRICTRFCIYLYTIDLN